MQTARLILPPTPAECVADADITTAIKMLLATKKGLSASGITVRAREGIVELAVPTPDYALAERIRTRYCWSASLHDQDVDVRVENGRATLTGTVDTWLDRKHAAQTAHEAGAREVNNHLRGHPAVRQEGRCQPGAGRLEVRGPARNSFELARC